MNEEERGKQVRAVLCIVALALIMRTAAAALPDAFADDPDDYLRFALQFCETGVYGPVPGKPSAYRSPGYPLLLCGLAHATGGRTLAELWPAILALHLAASAILVGATAALARRFGGPRAAIAAAALVAVNPVLVRQSAAVMSETVFASALMATLSSWFGAAAAPTLRRVVCTGCLLAAAALIRPIAIPVWLAAGLATGSMRSLRVWIACSAIAATAYAPWPARNFQWSGRPILATTHGGYTLWLGQNPSFFEYEVVRGEPWPEAAFQSWTAENDRATIHLSELERDAAFRQMAWNWMRGHPGAAARSAVYHVWSFWRPLPRRTGQEVVRWLTGLYALLLFLLGAAAVLRLPTFRTPPGLTLPLVMIAATAVHALYWSNIRMRSPFEPLLAVMAACALVQIRLARLDANAN